VTKYVGNWSEGCRNMWVRRRLRSKSSSYVHLNKKRIRTEINRFILQCVSTYLNPDPIRIFTGSFFNCISFKNYNFFILESCNFKKPKIIFLTREIWDIKKKDYYKKMCVFFFIYCFFCFSIFLYFFQKEGKISKNPV